MHIYKSAARNAKLKNQKKQKKQREEEEEEEDTAAAWRTAEWRPLVEEWGGRGAIYLSFFFFLHDSLLLYKFLKSQTVDLRIIIIMWERLGGRNVDQIITRFFLKQNVDAKKNKTNKQKQKQTFPSWLQRVTQTPGPETNQSEASSGGGGRLSNTAR